MFYPGFESGFFGEATGSPNLYTAWQAARKPEREKATLMKNFETTTYNVIMRNKDSNKRRSRKDVVSKGQLINVLIVKKSFSW